MSEFSLGYRWKISFSKTKTNFLQLESMWRAIIIFYRSIDMES